MVHSSAEYHTAAKMNAVQPQGTTNVFAWQKHHTVPELTTPP